MPRDTHAEPIAEAAIEAPYREAYPGWEDCFKPIEARTAAGKRFAAASTLHELLRLALDDFELVSRDPRYAINLGSWHVPASENSRRCAVCLAGSVIAGSLAAPIESDLGPDDFTEEIEVRLLALDCLRSGDVLGAGNHLHGIAADVGAAVLTDKYKPALRRFVVNPLVTSERAALFLATMQHLQRALARAGL